MSLFVNKDGTRKSPVVMLGFCMGLLFAAVFWVLAMLLAKPLYEHVSVGGSQALSSALHCMVIAVLGTAVCCLFFLLPDKRIVPIGFAFLAVFMLVFYAMAFTADAEGRLGLLYFVTLHFLAPVLVGNAVSWALYLKLRKTPARRLQGGRL